MTFSRFKAWDTAKHLQDPTFFMRYSIGCGDFDSFFTNQWCLLFLNSAVTEKKYEIKAKIYQ